ncbi:MAG: hypothetical protein AAFY54_13340 [Cyanobacteria bacterium J06648_10]
MKIQDLKFQLLLAKMKYHRQQEQAQSFSDFIETLVADIPASVLDTLPSDSAAEHDHYLHSTPKKEYT